MALSTLALLHWDQFMAIWGMGSVPADWHLRLKQPPLSKTYLAAVLMAIMVMEVGPYGGALADLALSKIYSSKKAVISDR